MARLAAAALLAALLAPSASGQFIYVANAGEDTVSKIDINSNTEVARYATWFTPNSPHNYVAHLGSPTIGAAPSRLLEDSAGNLFVLNRFFDPGHRPVLLKIAPSGGNPGTTTSNGSTALDINDANNNNEIDVNLGEAKDVRIQWAQPIGANGELGRALCMDTTGVLWVGMWTTGKYYRVDATTGQVLAPTGGIASGHTPYGCQVDMNGKLWSVDSNFTLVEIDTTVSTYPATPRFHGAKLGPPPTNFGQNYSLSLFNGCGSAPSKIYLSERQLAKTYIAYDPQTSLFSNPPGVGNPPVPLFNSFAVGVDMKGNIISGRQTGFFVGTTLTDSGRVIKTDPSGNVLWDTNVPPAGPAVPAADLHGVIIDEHNDVWAVLLQEHKVAKYSGGDGHFIATVNVGDSPYTYGNPPPPGCPCAPASNEQIKCEGKNDKGEWVYSWSFTFTNNSPFSMPATGIDISSSQVTLLTPKHVQFPNAVPPKGQATVSGTFTLAQPVPGSQICFDIRLNFGEGTGWCCPTEHVCFVLPDCACASLQGKFRCNHGRWFLDLSVTNLGPTAAQGAQIFSNTPGVTISPQTTNLAFPQNIPVMVPLTITGATPGQSISLSVMLHGPIDPKTGVYSWCCTATVKLKYPAKLCWWLPGGWIFDDINANGIRDSGEGGLPEWTVTLTDAKGKTHTTKSDASGKYQFEEIEPGKYRLSVQPPKGWRATTLKGGVAALTAEGPPKEKLDFGFVKTR